MFVAINRICVQKSQGDSLVQRFGASEGLSGQPGILGFELLRRTWMGSVRTEASNTVEQEEEEFLAISRWETEEQFHVWTKSDAFKRAHGGHKAHAKPAGEQQACAKSEAASTEASGAQCPSGARKSGGMKAQAAGYDVAISKDLAPA